MLYILSILNRQLWVLFAFEGAGDYASQRTINFKEYKLLLYELFL